MDDVVPILCALAANSMAHWVRDVETMRGVDSSYMFPLLTGNHITIRRNLIGFLANCCVHVD